MLNNGNNLDCGFGDDIVSYMYDELALIDRNRFESHLTGCTACTDEFAAIADARYSVFDWRKSEFAPLETPAIVIPYDQPAVHKDRAALGAFAAFGEMVRSWRLAFAAALVALAGVSVLTFIYLEKPERLTASSVASDIKVPEINKVENVVDEPTEFPAKPGVEAARLVDVRSHTARPVKVRTGQTVARTHTVLRSATVADKAVKSGVNMAPVLSNYEENEDRSLRLADLFDTEVGVR